MTLDLTDYEQSLLSMMQKFGPAISSPSKEDRENSLQELVKKGYATITRNDIGQIKYALTREGHTFLDTQKTNAN